MEKKNMSFTKDGGLKVGVKERSAEHEQDKTQKYVPSTLDGSGVVRMWRLMIVCIAAC